MNISKHGNSTKEELNTENFKCEQCGCEFSANYDEYYVEKGSSIKCPSSLTYVYTVQVTDTYVCSCPECHKIVTKGKQRINENPCISLSYIETDSNYST